MATISGLFEDYAAAQTAVERLVDIGVPASDISLIVQKERVVEPEVVEEAPATATGTATGALLGAVGGLLVGAALLAVPGVGPVLAAGPLAAVLGGAAIGAATGGLIGAIVDLGVSEEYARIYVREIERGSTLLVVRTNAVPPEEVRDILAESGATNIHSTPAVAAV
jgi:uncharacterized membrane protein